MRPLLAEEQERCPVG